MERRDFFKSIAGLFAVGVIDPASLLVPTGVDAANVKPIQFSFTRLTQFMHAQLAKELRGYNFPNIGVQQKISRDFPYQYGVDLEIDFAEIQQRSDDMIVQRYVAPAMQLIAKEVEANKAVRFARLALPEIRTDSIYGVDAACR